MAVVKIDIKRDFNIWNNINLSDPVTVKGLLRHRHKFDVLFYEKELGSSFVDYAEYSEDISILFMDLDDIINNVNFKERQSIILEMYQLGYTEQEIGENLDSTQPAISKTIDVICKMISDENNWRYLKVMYLKTLELKGKKCRICGELLPAIDEFYTPMDINKDGLISTCKKCRRKQQ